MLAWHDGVLGKRIGGHSEAVREIYDLFNEAGTVYSETNLALVFKIATIKFEPNQEF